MQAFQRFQQSYWQTLYFCHFFFMCGGYISNYICVFELLSSMITSKVFEVFSIRSLWVFFYSSAIWRLILSLSEKLLPEEFLEIKCKGDKITVLMLLNPFPFIPPINVSCSQLASVSAFLSPVKKIKGWLIASRNGNLCVLWIHQFTPAHS